MNDHREQLWEDLHELLQGLDSKFSGPEEAGMGSYGRKLVRKLIEAEMLHGAEWPDEYREFFRAGFESLVSDYRISESDLKSMRFACYQLRLGASAESDPDISHTRNPDTLGGNR